MSTAIVPVNGQVAVKKLHHTRSDLEFYAKIISAGNVWRGKFANESCIMVAIAAGATMGMDWFEAASSIDIIQGTPCLNAAAMRSKVLQSPDWDIREIRRTDKVCEMAFFKKNTHGEWEERGRSIWTEEKSKRAGLLGKDNYKKFPEAMNLARATSDGVRAFCPHLLFGFYPLCSEEMEDAKEDRQPLYPPAKVDESQDAVIVTPDEQREEKIEEIADLLDANSIDEKKFLTHYKVANIAGMTPAQMTKALTLLRARDAARYAKEKLDAESQHIASDDGMPVAEPAE